MRCIHYEVCTGKQTSIGNGGSVMVYVVSALAVVLVHSSPTVQHTDHDRLLQPCDFEIYCFRCHNRSFHKC